VLQIPKTLTFVVIKISDIQGKKKKKKKIERERKGGRKNLILTILFQYVPHPFSVAKIRFCSFFEFSIFVTSNCFAILKEMMQFFID
jgi:hypothetical protein